MKKYKDLKKVIDYLSVGGASDELEQAHRDLKAYEEEQWSKIKSKIKETTNFLKGVAVFIGDEVHHAQSDSWYRHLS